MNELMSASLVIIMDPNNGVARVTIKEMRYKITKSRVTDREAF